MSEYSDGDQLMLRAMGIQLTDSPGPEATYPPRPAERSGEAELYWKIATSMIRQAHRERSLRIEMQEALERSRAKITGYEAAAAQWRKTLAEAERLIRRWMAIAVCACAGLIAALLWCWLQRVAGGR